MLNKFFVINCMFLFSPFCIAEAKCTSTITGIGFESSWDSPYLTISLKEGPKGVRVCDLRNKHNNIDPDICKIIHGQSLAALMAGKTVTFEFLEYDSCGAVPSWGAPKISYHGISN